MRQILFILLIISFTKSINAQKTWSVYTELLGSGELYSINGAYRFTKKRNFEIRTGFMYITDFDPIVRTVHHLNYILGTKHSIEFGVGISTGFRFRTNYVRKRIIPTGAIMYRYNGDKGLLLRAGITPVFTGLDHNSNTFRKKYLHYLYPGISFGYQFGKKNKRVNE